MPLNGIGSTRLRVLVIDGDADFSTSLKDVLDRTGSFEVAAAGSAIEAGAAAAQLKPQAIVVDVDTSEITPRSVCRFVRGLPQSDVPCLIGTGRGLSEARGQGLIQEGFHAWLPKPFDVRSLVRLIEQQTGGTAQPQEGQANGNPGLGELQ
jgi:two-component system CheB/CheR fusion protein